MGVSLFTHILTGVGVGVLYTIYLFIYHSHIIYNSIPPSHPPIFMVK